MRNKVFKYIKFLVSMVLIVSLVAPSYASLSASDGSAFVTKSEFDSALADFNARLTTFEAGINSKIDSQVTTYLDRNGIWNGANQLFLWKKRTFTIKFSTTDSKSNITAENFANMLNGKTDSTMHDESGTWSADVLLCRDYFIEENRITKTGLCFIRHKLESVNTEFYFQSGGLNGKPDWNYKCHFTNQLEIGTTPAFGVYDETKPKIVRTINSATVADCQSAKSSGNVAYTADWTQTLGRNTTLLYADDWTAQDCCFVTKGDYFTIQLIAKASGNPSNCYFSGGKSAGPATWVEGTWELLDCAVY